MKTFTKILIALTCIFLVAGVAVFVINGKKNTGKVLKVGIATWPGFAPGYIANAKNFFGDLKVEFYIIDDFSARQASFKSGKTDLTIGTIDSYAFDQGNGIDGKAILVLDKSNGADGIVVKNEISSVSDLKGKKVAYTRGSPSQFFLMQLLKRNGMTTKDIEVIEVDDPGKAGEAFISGNVDAAVTWEPNISQIATSGKGKILATSKTSPDLLVDIMESNITIVNDRKDDLRQFVNGWLKAVDYISTNKDEAYKIMAKGINIPEQDFPNMANGLIYADRKLNNEWLLPNDHSKASKLYDEANDIWVAEKLVQTSKSSNGLFVSDFIN